MKDLITTNSRKNRFVSTSSVTHSIELTATKGGQKAQLSLVSGTTSFGPSDEAQAIIVKIRAIQESLMTNLEFYRELSYLKTFEMHGQQKN